MNSLPLLLVLPLLAAVALAAKEKATAKHSACLSASEDPGRAKDFLVDANRTFPMLYLVGDSTVHNAHRVQRSWGDVLDTHFATNRIRVENHALGGRSSRTFITQGWWDLILKAAKPGDFVLIQMGHNDAGPLDDTSRARGTLRSAGEETQEIFNPITQQKETVHSYGWYLRKYVADARAAGMTPILCTPIPHCPSAPVKPGDVEDSEFVRIAAAVAEAEKVPLVDINRLTMAEYAKRTPAEIKEKYFTSADGTHTSVEGAELNARSVVEGLRRLKDCPLAGYLRPDAGQ
jgi:lysophospholipase L1-like esterase